MCTIPFGSSTLRSFGHLFIARYVQVWAAARAEFMAGRPAVGLPWRSACAGLSELRSAAAGCEPDPWGWPQGRLFWHVRRRVCGQCLLLSSRMPVPLRFQSGTVTCSCAGHRRRHSTRGTPGWPFTWTVHLWSCRPPGALHNWFTPGGDSRRRALSLRGSVSECTVRRAERYSNNLPVMHVWTGRPAVGAGPHEKPVSSGLPLTVLQAPAWDYKRRS